MSLLGRIGNGMKTAGRLLPVLAMGYAAQNTNAQMFVPLPGVGIGKGANRMNMGVYVGPDGPQTTLSGRGGYIMFPPTGNGGSQQQNQQQEQQQYSTKRIGLSKPILWRDLNGDEKIQENEVVSGEPKVGVWYKVSMRLVNADGVLVRISIGGHPEMNIRAETDDTTITNGIRFANKPTLVRFDVLDGNSWRKFFPTEE